ncbi:MAG: hypothetical protein IT204_23565 [Fimbriimonadaceae bacterium]|nr:hypothetical protein [Fimbriimonadaceae bacterium]
MEFFDAHASLGHWPFRSHPVRTAAQLLARYDSCGIARGLVGSLSAVCYRDPQAGNDELLAELAPHRERLLPLAVLDPGYAGFERDLAACQAAGCVGVRLFPNYHRYELTAAPGRRALGAVAEAGLLACFVCRHEDRRQRHWLDDPEDLELAALAAGLQPFPTLRFLVLEGIGYQASPFVTDPRWRERRFGLDVSRLETVLYGSIDQLAASLGGDKLVCGSGLPLKGPHSALLKLDLLPDRALAAAVGGTNLMALLQP